MQMALSIEFTRKVWHFSKTIVHLQSNFALSDWKKIEIWCNGSITDSGSVGEGSNPSISTKIPYYGNGGIAQLVRAYDS